MEKIYKTKFTKEIKIETPKEAAYVLTHFCDYCTKDSISKFHCSGHDASICEQEKNKIIKDCQQPTI